MLCGLRNTKKITGVVARTKQYEEENEETGIKPAWTEITDKNEKKIMKMMEDRHKVSKCDCCHFRAPPI